MSKGMAMATVRGSKAVSKINIIKKDVGLKGGYSPNSTLRGEMYGYPSTSSSFLIFVPHLQNFDLVT